MRRYAMYYDPSARETLAAKCLELNRPGEAAWLYWNVMNDTTFMSPSGSTKADIWMALANVCTQYPEESLKVGIDFAALVHHALVPAKLIWSVLEEETTDGEELSSTPPSALLHLGELEGSLWGKLADYYTRMGDFDMARSTYEEGMEAVTKVRDFSILFDAYMKLEEGIVEAMMEEQGNDERNDDNDIENDNDESHDPDDWDILLVSQGPGSHHHMADMELALARAEHLTMRRPLLLNRVLLQQNPHNVGEWLHRAELYQQRQQDQNTMACAALEEALTKVHARKATNGTPSLVVLALLKLYEASSLDNARHLMERICHNYEYTFANVDDMAQCYSAWVELELRHEAWDEALSIARQAVAAPDGTATGGAMAKVVRNLNKSIRLWDLLLDLEESLGSLATTKDAYSRALEMKVATPMHVLNFASFLKEQKYFEEAFSAYERGVEMFTFPASKLLWNAYLADFIERYKGQKVERVRDLFERCLEGCPAEEASEFCIMNGAFEEEFGLTKRALNAYKQMCQLVPKEEKYKAYQLYIAKTTKYMGVTATRDIYQEAISSLDDEPAAKLCMDFAKMETSLQELERARAVLTYGAQMADPRRLPEYWKKWHDFEVSHGNEETFREMLRIKRSVQAAFSTVNYNATGMDQDLNPLSDEQAMSMIADQEGVEYNQIRRKEEASNVFVSQKRSAGDAQLEDVENRVAKLRKATGAVEHTGDDEIDIDDLEEDDDAPSSSPVKNVSTKAIPTAVFGSLVNE
jgi:pre-mRNA-splicing factor SYF1